MCSSPVRIEVNTEAAASTAILTFPSSVFNRGDVTLFSRGGVFAWPGDGEDYAFPASHVWTTLETEPCISQHEPSMSPLCSSGHFASFAPNEEDASGGANETSQHASLASLTIDGAASSPAAVALGISIVAANLDVGTHTVSIETSDIDHDGCTYTLMAAVINVTIRVHEVPRIKYALKPTAEVVYGAHEEEVPILQHLTKAEQWDAAVPSTAAEFESFLRNNGKLVGNIFWSEKVWAFPHPDFNSDTWTMEQVEDYIYAEYLLENDVEQGVRFKYNKYEDSWAVYRRAGFLCGQCDSRNTLCKKCTATEHILVLDTENPFRVYGLDAIDSSGASVAGGSDFHLQPGSISVDKIEVLGGSGNGDASRTGAIQIGIISGGVSEDVRALPTASSDAADSVVVRADSSSGDVYGNDSDWAVISSSQVGASCGMLGVERAAFLSQSDRCSAESESCTGPRLANLVSESARANVTMTSRAHLEEADVTSVLVLELNAHIDVAVSLTRSSEHTESQQLATPNSLIFAEPRLHPLGASTAEVSKVLGEVYCAHPAVTLTA